MTFQIPLIPTCYTDFFCHIDQKHKYIHVYQPAVTHTLLSHITNTCMPISPIYHTNFCHIEKIPVFYANLLFMKTNYMLLAML